MTRIAMSKEVWDALEHANDSCREKGCKDHRSANAFSIENVTFIPHEEYIKILTEMGKTFGTAPKAEPEHGAKKGKGKKEED